MRNYKLEKKLFGKENWPEVSSVFLKAISDQEKITPNLSDEKKRNVIESWNKVAVLKATSQKKLNFYLGFASLNKIQYLKHTFETDLTFGMRIGTDDIRFFVLPLNLDGKINLDLLEITDINDAKYKDLILI